MKKIFLLLALALTGCAITKFDSTEYLQATSIYTNATFYKNDCASYQKSMINANALYQETSIFTNYTVELSNKDVATSAKILNSNVRELADHYNTGKKVNPLHCTLKYQIIESEANVIRHVLGGNPK